MKKLTLFALLFVLCATVSMAQQESKNVVKLGLFGLAGKNLRFSYERLLTKRISVQLSAAFLLERGMPTFFEDKLKEEDTSGTSSSSAFSLDYIKLRGFNLMPELRIYGKKHGAGKGFYWGPYFKFNRYSLDFGGLSSGTLFSAEGKFTSFGLGLNIGTQWTIGKHISIDWNFLSVGVNFGHLSADFSSYNTFVNTQDWADEFNASDSSVPMFGKFTASPTSNGIQVKTGSAPVIGIASRLAICVRF
ncbi:MAG: DUF3575 domain-containing protein [Flavobacteriia bacterium]|nr:DUF3575 domain-containing protein [Flavobacteriia bacterium]